MEILAGIFSASLATYLVYWNHVNASTTGFSLNMAGKFVYVISIRQNLTHNSRFQRYDHMVGQEFERPGSQQLVPINEL